MIDGATLYYLNVGLVDPDLIEILMTLAREAKTKPLWRDDEVLDELLEPGGEEDERLTFTEVISAIVSTGTLYQWGPGGTNPLSWSFGAWSSSGVLPPSVFTTGEALTLAELFSVAPGSADSTFTTGEALTFAELFSVAPGSADSTLQESDTFIFSESIPAVTAGSSAFTFQRGETFTFDEVLGLTGVAALSEAEALAFAESASVTAGGADSTFTRGEALTFTESPAVSHGGAAETFQEDETLTFSESIPPVVSTDTTYQWGPEGANPLRWDEGVWSEAPPPSEFTRDETLAFNEDQKLEGSASLTEDDTLAFSESQAVSAGSADSTFTRNEALTFSESPTVAHGGADATFEEDDTLTFTEPAPSVTPGSADATFTRDETLTVWEVFGLEGSGSLEEDDTLTFAESIPAVTAVQL